MFKTKQVSNNKFKVDIIKDDEYIGPCIERGFEWDGWMRQIIEQAYKQGTDLIDVGANIGYNTLMFSDYGPVHSFEPLFFPIIEKNISQNELKHPVVLHKYGLSDETKIAKIYVTKMINEGYINYGASSLYLTENHNENDSHEISLKRLDDIYTGTPSFMKVDVEGHDLEVLKGAENILRKHHPALIIEVIDEAWHNKEDIFNFIRNIGYTRGVECPDRNILFLV
jgi:FkbM family methyltransferase